MHVELEPAGKNAKITRFHATVTTLGGFVYRLAVLKRDDAPLEVVPASVRILGKWTAAFAIPEPLRGEVDAAVLAEVARIA